MSKRRDEIQVPTSPLQVAVTLPVAASLFDIHPSTFDRHIRPHLRLLHVGSKELVSLAELQRFAEENSTSPLD